MRLCKSYFSYASVGRQGELFPTVTVINTLKFLNKPSKIRVPFMYRCRIRV